MTALKRRYCYRHRRVIAAFSEAINLSSMTFVLNTLRRPRGLQVALLTLGLLSTSGIYASHAQAPAAAAASQTPPLPSGLAAVSQVEVAGAQLALDANGALFRTDKHGKHWRQIHQQWNGKAIELLGMPPLTAAPGRDQAPRDDDDDDQGVYAAVLLRSTQQPCTG